MTPNYYPISLRRRQESVQQITAALKPWVPAISPELTTNALFASGLWDELALAEDRWATYRRAYEQVKDENARLQTELHLKEKK